MALDPARAKSLFLVASDLNDPAERAAYLDRECGNNAELRARIETLLRADDASPLAQSPEGESTWAFSSDAQDNHSIAIHSSKQEQANTVIAGKYMLVEPIGEGGMGSVWRARQTEPVKRFVAVKLIKAGMDSRQVIARFEAERQALALMDHPNIAKVLDGGLHNGRPFFVMELVKGVPITEFCDVRRLPPKERLQLFVQVCEAIQHAHQKGIIHRDIKPSNVLIALYDDNPVVKVIDFGVAKATGEALTEHTVDTGFGGVIGTPQYMSPEQATFNNLDIDTRSDVYALGVLLYELLTGSPPFARKELEKRGLLEILRVVREEDPPRPSTKLSTADAMPRISANRGTEPKNLTTLLRNELDWIVMKALEKDRTRRYDSANGFAADVQRYLSGEPVQAHPSSTIYRIKKFVRRNQGRVIGACLVLLALVAGIVGTTTGLLLAKRQQQLAEQATKEERNARERMATVRASLRETMTNQMADRLRADLQRLSTIGDALAATVEQGDTWDEKRFVAWMTRVLETEPEVLGLCIAFEPGTFDPTPKQVPVRAPLLAPLPPGPDSPVPLHDGYSLYVRRRNSASPDAPVSEALKPEYRYRTQGWYANTLKGDARGWEEPTPDLHGEMVSYTAQLRRRTGNKPIGVLCVDLSVAYFDRLDSWLQNQSFGVDSYGFLLSSQGKVISHPHLRDGPARDPRNPFPTIGERWPAPEFKAAIQKILTHRSDNVGQLTATDPATDRLSQFLFVRFKPANWVFVAVIPVGDG